MPSTITKLFDEASIQWTGVVPWSAQVNSTKPGIYVVSLSKDSSQNCGTLGIPPIDHKLVRQWMQRVSTFTLDGNSNPSITDVVKRLSSYWLPDESVLYIGQTTSQNLKTRIRQYYTTCLGNSKPHRGGHWIKTLSVLGQTFVHYAEDDDPKLAECRLLKTFVDNISSETKKSLYDRNHPFPFANLEFPKGRRKQHGINRSTLS